MDEENCIKSPGLVPSHFHLFFKAEGSVGGNFIFLMKLNENHKHFFRQASLGNIQIRIIIGNTHKQLEFP